MLESWEREVWQPRCGFIIGHEDWTEGQYADYQMNRLRKFRLRGTNDVLVVWETGCSCYSSSDAYVLVVSPSRASEMRMEFKLDASRAYNWPEIQRYKR